MSFEWWFPCIMHRLIVTIVKGHMLILDVCFFKSTQAGRSQAVTSQI